MSEPKIVIEPKNWQGWELEFHPSYQEDSRYRAEKDGIHLCAGTLSGLMDKIHRSREVIKRFPRPLRVLNLSDYKPEWAPVDIHTIHSDEFIYRGVDGSTFSARFDALSLDRERNRGRKFIHDSPENRAKLKKADQLEARGRALHDEARKVRQSVTPVTEADVRLAAGV